MVAELPRYRSQSDPDGVIHVSDDDVVDLNNDTDYIFAKDLGATATQTPSFVDVTHIVDPPDDRESQQYMDRRDPPTEPGSPIYDVKSIASNGQLSDIAEEMHVGRLGPAKSSPLRRDPSLNSPSTTRPSPSVLDSNSPLANIIGGDKSVAPPVRNVGSHLQEVISVESIDRAKERATSPISSTAAPSGLDIEREELPPTSSGSDPTTGTSKPATITPPLGLQNERPKSPDFPKGGYATAMGAEKGPKASEALLLKGIPTNSIAIKEATASEEEEYLTQLQLKDPTDRSFRPQACAGDEGAWIFSGLMNTLTCRGPDPIGAHGDPLGLVGCGTAGNQETVVAQDEEENSVLGPKGFGDLASLPSLEDSIIQRAGDNDADTESLSSKVSRSSIQTEYLGNAVETKIKNLEMEQIVAGTKNKITDSEVEDSLLDPEVQHLLQELHDTTVSCGPYDVKCAHISSVLAQRYTDKKAFKKALDSQLRAVNILSVKLGDHHQDTLEAKICLGKCQENAEEYDEGMSSFYEVMKMKQAQEGEKDPSTSDALILIANCLRKKGQYVQAIRELKRALKVYRDSLGDCHPSVASTVDEIASLYVTLGDFEKSAAILEEVVKLKAATLGMQNKKVASSLVELATSYECSEDFDRAVKALKKAYKIYTDLDGFSCEEATSTLHRIALIYQASGDIHKAAIAYLGVLRGKKHLLGDDHLDVAETYYRLGVCLRETNQLDKALKCMKEALPILVGKGKNIHDVDMIAEVMHEMALLYKAKRQLAEAAKIFKQELTVRRKIGQPEYPCIAKTLNHLGVTEYEMKMHRRALKHLLEVLTVFQERQEQGIDFAEALYNIGLVFEAVRNQERAYEAFLEAARVFKANGYANDHPHMAKAVNKVKRLASRK